MHPLACSPKTGQRLRHGPALRERAKMVELPAVTALFADIASPKPKRAWDLNPSPGTAQEMPPPPLVMSLYVSAAAVVDSMLISATRSCICDVAP